MDGPRAPSPEEFPEVLHFLTENLRKDKGWSIADEYPLALGATNRDNVRVIKENGRYLSGAAVKISLVKSPAGLFKVAGIGSVVTDPAHRNLGHSRTVLESTLNLARQNACDIAILWTDLHDFYRKLGFELAGTEVSAKISQPLSQVTAGALHFLDSLKVGPEAILRLYGQHTCGSMRSVEDIRKYLTIPRTRVHTAWNEQQHLVAYAIEGKGADLTGYIHEWGGSVSNLLALLNFIHTNEKREVTLISPAHSRNLLRQLEASGAKLHHGVLGMIKILNPDLFYAKIRRYARQLGHEDFVLERRAGQTYFGFGDHLFCTDSEIDVVRLIFGPTAAHELHAFEPDTTIGLEKIFPIPFWIWGWDSV